MNVIGNEHCWSNPVRLVLVALCGLLFLGTAKAETATVLRVIDGDTSLLEDGRRVRYLGINAPEEGDPHAREAKLANNSLVGGREIRMEFLRAREDSYGRILAYVFVNDTLVNEALVRQGHGHISFRVGAKYGERFRQAQQKARAEGLGIWEKAADRFIEIVNVHADAEGDDRRNLNDEYIVIENQSKNPIDMTGWTIADASSGNPYLFPNFTLPGETQLTLRTGFGKNSEKELYWGSRRPIWNNKGDTAFIRDAEGHLISVYVYP